MTVKASSRHPLPGDLVAGKYRVDRILGAGGMGVVLAATHEQLEQKVALKFLLPEIAAHPDIVQRFLREARAAVKIHSEHVARVLDVGTHDGVPYMVMEYLEGGDLAHVLAERGPLPLEEAVGYVLQGCEALAEAHALGIIHRDLKPANLFLAKRTTGPAAIKVLDFGISKAPSTGNDANLTKTSSLMGSPSYMSPEQLVAAASVDVRTDIWALGVVLYELLTGSLPFLADTMPELVAIILQRHPEPILRFRADLPAAFATVVHRCTEKEAARRYADIAELARALLPFAPTRSAQSVERIEHVLGQGGSRAENGEARGVRLVSARAQTFSPATSSVASTPGRRASVAWPLAAVCLVAIAGALILRASKGRTTSRAPSGSATPSPATSSPSEGLLASPPTSAAAVDSPPASSASATPKALGDPKALAADAPAASSPKGRLPSPPPHAIAPPASPSSAPCRAVSYFDEDGNKRFKPCQ